MQMNKILTAAALAAATVLPASAQQPAAATAQTPSAHLVPTPAVSQERLNRIRQSLLRQIAVHDQAEGAMRQPTAAESAALAPTAVAGAERIVALPGGGAALRADPSSLSFLVVETQGDGKLAMRHDAATPKLKAQNTMQGGAHVR
jgi:hypothetical protein